ncbi:MAG: hypothetical protein ACRYHA_17325 [Janthinobacterium lividum]
MSRATRSAPLYRQPAGTRLPTHPEAEKGHGIVGIGGYPSGIIAVSYRTRGRRPVFVSHGKDWRGKLIMFSRHSRTQEDPMSLLQAHGIEASGIDIGRRNLRFREKHRDYFPVPVTDSETSLSHRPDVPHFKSKQQCEIMDPFRRVLSLSID